MVPTIHNTVIIIPTLNAGTLADEMIAAFKAQAFPARSYLIVDSGSTDGTIEKFEEFGAEVIGLNGQVFNHGGTRHYAACQRPDAEYFVFMTHDAIPANKDAISEILRSFENPNIALSYGRQLPRLKAGPIERHARLFNYGDVPYIRSFEDRALVGVKTIFCSNSFCAYRASAYHLVGGFGKNVYFAEDQLLAAALLKSGFQISYCPQAQVYHSHEYSMREEFERYFDIGVFHSRNQWLEQEFGKAEGEGFRFISSELRYLVSNAPNQLIPSILRTALKYLGYRLGRLEALMPNKLKEKLAMQKSYWRSSSL